MSLLIYLDEVVLSSGTSIKLSQLLRNRSLKWWRISLELWHVTAGDVFWRGWWWLCWWTWLYWTCLYKKLCLTLDDLIASEIDNMLKYKVCEPIEVSKFCCGENRQLSTPFLMLRFPLPILPQYFPAAYLNSKLQHDTPYISDHNSSADASFPEQLCKTRAYYCEAP